MLLNRGEVVVDGDPADAVAAFRDILEERRLADLKPDAQKQGGVGFTAVTITPTDVADNDDVLPGSDLEFDLRLQSDLSMHDLTIAVQINSTSGQDVWGTTTKRMGIVLPDLIGEHTVRFTLRDTRFGPGKYFLNLSIIDPSGVHLHDWLQAASFDAFDHRTTYGVISTSPEFSILDS